MITRRRLIAASATTGLAHAIAGLAPQARAQAIAKSARLLVGFPPGGSIDVVARLLVDQMKSYAASVIVDNRPGAGGRLVLDALKGSDPDGSVIVVTPGDQVTLFPHVYAKLSYDPLKDFVPVTTVCTVQFLLTIGPMVPAQVKTLADFIEWCRANPKLATYGTPGAGSRPHFLGVALARAAGFDFVYSPYKGGPPAIQDLLGGQLPATISVLSNALPHIRSGHLRALATTAPQRSVLLPDVATFKEAGYPTLEGVEWFGILAPANTPADVVNALNHTIRRALETDAVKAGLTKLAFETAGTSPSDFARLMRFDIERWGTVVRESGFHPMD
jgi:tripartite-type tricarboxylate transporter receptor subunit TctC